MIKHLSATNLKNADFAYDMGPVTMVCGDNFSGKSTVIEAARLGLIGHLPRLGKQPGATMRLAGELRPEMTVGAVLAAPAPDGSVLETSVLQKWTRTKKGASYDIEGELPAIPPVALDLRDYFTRTAAERVKFVFDKIDLTNLGFDDDQILARLQKIETTPAALSVIAVKAMLEAVDSTIKDRARFNLTRQVWMDKLVAKLKADASDYKAKAEYNSSQQTAIHKQMAPKSPKSVAAELEAKRKEMTDLTARKQTLTEAFTRYQQLEQHRAALVELLKTAPPNPDELTPKITEVGQQIALREQAQTETNAHLARLRERHRNHAQRLDECTKSIETARQRLTELLSQPACPTCKTKRKGWQEEVQADIEAQIKIHEGDVQTMTQSLADIAEEGKKHRADAEALRTALETLRKEAAALAAEHQSRLLRQAEYAGAQREQATMNESNPKPDLTDLPAIDEQLTGMSREVNDLVAQEAAYQSFVQQKTKKDEVESEAIKFKIHQTIFKMAVDEIVAIQAEMVQVAIGDLLTRAHALTNGLLRAPLEFRDGELGMTIDNGWVSHETFSGTEEALAFAGFSLALASESPLRIVIIDEMDRLETKRRLALLERMVKLVKAGVIHQFIGAGIDPEKYANLSGVTLIRIGCD